MLYLKKANYDDAEKEFLFVRDMPADENGMTNDWHGVSRKDFTDMALPAMIASSEGRNLPAGYVPETFLFLCNDDEIVGLFRLRHHLCESLVNGSGHIGYYIRPEYRGRGFGKEGLRLTLEYARDIIPEDEIYLRVYRDNEASLSVMLHNGGYINHSDEKYHYVRIRKQ